MSSAERSFNWITLDTADGRHVAGVNIPGMPVTAGAAGDLFDLIQQEDGKVALFSLATEGYVSVTPEQLGAWSHTAGEQQAFVMIEEKEGRVAFQQPDGIHYLSAAAGDEVPLTADAEAVGPNELFVLNKFDASALPPGRPGCCHAWTRPVDEPGILWNDVTHQRILEWAIIGMRDPKIQNDETRRLMSFWRRAEFHEGAFKGLDDADYEHPWRGHLVLSNPFNPRESVYTWHDHFYNPTTRKNYMQQPTNAVTEGARYFNLSVQLGMRMMKLGGFNAPSHLLRRAGFYLGISLHFLTDLTQPMHAANFSNVYGGDGGYPWRVILWDKRHTMFETYAEDEVKKGYFDNYDKRYPMEHKDVETGDVVDATWFLHHTGVNQHKVFFDRLGKVLHDMGATDRGWTAGEATPAMTDALLKAPKAVARYLAYWAKCVNQDWDHIDPGYYYRILAPGGKEWVCLHNGHYKRDTMTNGQDLMFFIFNPDGTWSIGCRSYKNNLWLGYDGLGGHWIGENRSRVSSPPPTSRFRFVRNHAPGGADGVWIYEASMDEAVTVNEQGFPGQISYLIRWSGSLPAQQLFTLEKVARIPDSERSEIQSLWPDFLKLPWYGRE